MEATTITVPSIVTERLILRCWQPADLAPYAAMNEDPETMAHLNGTMDHAATERLVTHLIGMWHLRGFGMWAIELRQDGSFAGRAGLYQTSQWPDPEVAWSIRRDLWSQGLATEAGAAVLRFGFTECGLDRIISLPSPDNTPSVRVAEKLGLSFEKIATVGPWKDSAIYAVSRKLWRGKRA
ncbi:MAG: GNAT family N-acetyltransferase [Micromonosporaceae bacterium]